MGRTYGAIAAVMFLLHAGQTAAQTPSPNAYPAPRCTPPKFQVLPQAEDAKNTSTDAAKAALYEIEVKQFNREALAYHACLRKYIEAANQEAKRIQDQTDAEVKKITDNANASIATIHEQISKATADIKNASTAPESLGLAK